MARIRSTKSGARDGIGTPDSRRCVTDNFLTACLNWWGTGADGSLDVGANAQNYSVPCSTDDWVKVLNLTYLRVRAGYTMTTQYRCRGLAVYVDGDALIEGTLSMTARGAYTPNILSEVGANGLRIIRRKSGQTQTLSASDVTGAGSALIAAEASQQPISTNGKIYQIPRLCGAAGVAAGAAGGTLTMGTGGGGAGGQWYATHGTGTQGTCWGGGVGGGGAYNGAVAGNGTAYGGPGGAGAANYQGAAGGGAGNPGGAGAGNGYPTGPAGNTGTGGLLLLFVRGTLTIASTGVVSADGMSNNLFPEEAYGGGGATGGGVVLCLYGTGYTNSGVLRANGGVGGISSHDRPGGNGGAGHVLAEQIQV